MNELIKQLQNRRSVREFTGEKIKEEDLKTILATAQRAANSVNGQQTSLIVVRDKEKLAKIAELCGGQKHIAQADAFVFVLVDFHRGVYASNSLGKRNIAPKSADGILVGAVDAGIVVNALQTAALALGFEDTYDAKKVEEGVEFHEKDTVAWREENGTPQLPSYKEMTVRIYENFYNTSK